MIFQSPHMTDSSRLHCISIVCLYGSNCKYLSLLARAWCLGTSRLVLRRFWRRRIPRSPQSRKIRLSQHGFTGDSWNLENAKSSSRQSPNLGLKWKRLSHQSGLALSRVATERCSWRSKQTESDFIEQSYDYDSVIRLHAFAFFARCKVP